MAQIPLVQLSPAMGFLTVGLQQFGVAQSIAGWNRGKAQPADRIEIEGNHCLRHVLM